MNLFDVFKTIVEGLQPTQDAEEAQATTNDYALVTSLDTSACAVCSAVVENDGGGGNSLDAKLMGRNEDGDGGFSEWVDLDEGTVNATVADNAVGLLWTLVVTDQVAVFAKSTSAGNHTTVTSTQTKF